MHIPERMCVACRQMKPKSELIRIVKSGDAAQIDKSGKKSGRGAYICKNIECFERAYKNKGLERSFKSPVPKDVYETLKRKLLNENNRQDGN